MGSSSAPLAAAESPDLIRAVRQNGAERDQAGAPALASVTHAVGAATTRGQDTDTRTSGRLGGMEPLPHPFYTRERTRVR
jgi:hypothetical protein